MATNKRRETFERGCRVVVLPTLPARYNEQRSYLVGREGLVIKGLSRDVMVDFERRLICIPRKYLKIVQRPE